MLWTVRAFGNSVWTFIRQHMHRNQVLIFDYFKLKLVQKSLCSTRIIICLISFSFNFSLEIWAFRRKGKYNTFMAAYNAMLFESKRFYPKALVVELFFGNLATIQFAAKFPPFGPLLVLMIRVASLYDVQEPSL